MNHLIEILGFSPCFDLQFLANIHGADASLVTPVNQTSRRLSDQQVRMATTKRLCIKDKHHVTELAKGLNPISLPSVRKFATC